MKPSNEPEPTEGRPDLRLEDLMTPERVRRLEDVLAARTWRTALVLENIHDPHNASACLRSADAFGIQTVFIVEAVHPFTVSRAITKGCERWLDLVRFPTTDACVEELKRRDFRICVSDLTDGTVPLESVDFSIPVALVFGNEHAGVSEAIRAAADTRFQIRMTGFSQSLNLSVAAAITMHHACVARGAPAEGENAAERHALRGRWLRTARRLNA